MKETLQEKVNRLEQELASVTEELTKHRSGLELQYVTWQRNILAKFANECERWGSDTCKCYMRANDALRKANMSEEEFQP